MKIHIHLPQLTDWQRLQVIYCKNVLYQIHENTNGQIADNRIWQNARA